MAALTLAGGLAAAPTSAATLGPVGSVTVTSAGSNDGTATVNVSWASVPADADGALVCLHRGTSTIQKPSRCESQIAVETPGLTSGAITIHPAKNYVVEVFSYEGTTPITYGPPVSRVRHGIKVGMSSRCGNQTVGSTCRFTTTVTDALTGSALNNRTVELWVSKERQPAKWSLLSRTATNRNGIARVSATLSKTRLYQWHYSAPRKHELASSSSRVDIPVVSS